ncbi:hypothetical protein BRADI_3g17610v3 [Brachypodium distachyon]|uniref:Uncharacterized protein n=1 Tax=Brachypodium distachyon TaxID=15368 RepID=I1I1T5_BRADI|nr:hypothetical protein BRADI_3g17610v3 [Brachypodium distachyon]
MEGRTTLCFLLVLALLGNCVHAETCSEKSNLDTACIPQYVMNFCKREYPGRNVKNAYCKGFFPFVFRVCQICG